MTLDSNPFKGDQWLSVMWHMMSVYHNLCHVWNSLVLLRKGWCFPLKSAQVVMRNSPVTNHPMLQWLIAILILPIWRYCLNIHTQVTNAASLASINLSMLCFQLYSSYLTKVLLLLFDISLERFTIFSDETIVANAGQLCTVHIERMHAHH